jgi:hypothetical protein
MVNAAYNKQAAVAWAKSCAFGCAECPAGTACGCTPFVSKALQKGGWGHGYEGMCKNMWANFKNGKYPGWVKTNSVSAGDVVIMDNGHNGPASHCCIGTGAGVVSCHNKEHLDIAPSLTWRSGGGINGIYTYTGASLYTDEFSDFEVADDELDLQV